MTTNEQKIVNDFLTYMNKNNKSANAWYVGITSNIQERLFNEHKVNKNGVWIYQNDISEQTARNVESYFIDTEKTQGGTGGGDEDINAVYAYLITSETVESE